MLEYICLKVEAYLWEAAGGSNRLGASPVSKFWLKWTSRGGGLWPDYGLASSNSSVFFSLCPNLEECEKVNLKPKVWAQRLLADPWGSERRSLEEPDEERGGGHQAPSPGVTGQPWRGAAPHR